MKLIIWISGHWVGVKVAAVVKVDESVSMGVKIAMIVAVEVGVLLGVVVCVLVAVAVFDGLEVGVIVGVKVLVRLTVGVLCLTAVFKLNEMIISPAMIARMAMDPMMVLVFNMISRRVKALPASQSRGHYQFL